VTQRSRMSPRIEFWAKLAGLTIFCAIGSASAWLNYGDEHPVPVIGAALAVYALGVWSLCDDYWLAPPILSKVFGGVLVLAIFGVLAWYFYPEDLLSTVRELFTIVGWFAFVAFAALYCIRTLQDE
jgi:hypothetical protein